MESGSNPDADPKQYVSAYLCLCKLKQHLTFHKKKKKSVICANFVNTHIRPEDDLSISLRSDPERRRGEAASSGCLSSCGAAWWWGSTSHTSSPALRSGSPAHPV
jgi:hypothetical protein